MTEKYRFNFLIWPTFFQRCTLFRYHMLFVYWIISGKSLLLCDYLQETNFGCSWLPNICLVLYLHAHVLVEYLNYDCVFFILQNCNVTQLRGTLSLRHIALFHVYHWVYFVQVFVKQFLKKLRTHLNNKIPSKVYSYVKK